MINIDKLKDLLSKHEDFKLSDTRTDIDFKIHSYDLPKNGHRISWGVPGRRFNIDDKIYFMTFLYDEDYCEHNNLVKKQFATCLYAPHLNLEDKDCFHYFVDLDKEPFIENVMDCMKKFIVFTDLHEIDFEIGWELFDDVSSVFMWTEAVCGE